MQCISVGSKGKINFVHREFAWIQGESVELFGSVRFTMFTNQTVQKLHLHVGKEQKLQKLYLTIFFVV